MIVCYTTSVFRALILDYCSACIVALAKTCNYFVKDGHAAPHESLPHAPDCLLHRLDLGSGNAL